MFTTANAVTTRRHIVQRQLVNIQVNESVCEDEAAIGWEELHTTLDRDLIHCCKNL